MVVLGKTLITGANGFVGQEIARAFLRADADVALAVRSRNNAMAQFPPSIVVETGPVNRATDWREVLSGVDTVIHCAGLAHRSASVKGAERDFFEVNLEGTRKLTEDSRSAGVRRFINISSIGAVTPNVATQVIGDDAVPVPINAYGRSKLEAERHVAAFASDTRLGISLRPPLITGAGAKGNWGGLQGLAWTGWPLPFAAIANRRSVLSVRNLASACLQLASRPWPSGYSGSYALADETPVSLAEIITSLREGMGIRHRLFPVSGAVFTLLGKVLRREAQIQGLTGTLVVDSSRFRRVFDWTPPLDALEGIQESGLAYAVLRKL